jgi:type IV secretion system protein VirB10
MDYLVKIRSVQTPLNGQFSIGANTPGEQLGQATVQMITKNMNIAPTLEIRPGYRFNILVTKDLTLSKPYEAFDY